MNLVTGAIDTAACPASDVCTTAGTLRDALAEARADLVGLLAATGRSEPPAAQQSPPGRQACPDCSWRDRFMIEFAGRLRGALHLSQRQVADRTQISQAKLSCIERGIVTPTEAECEQLAAALTLPPGTMRRPHRRRPPEVRAAG